MAAQQAKAKPQPKKPAFSVVDKMIDDLPESGDITVACKLPNGLIMRLFEMQEIEEVTLAGSRRVNIARLMDLPPVRLKGCAAPFGAAIQLFGGYSLTTGVDAEFFAEYLRQNRDSDIVRNRLIFAHESKEFVSDKAEESAEVRSGLQPLTRSEDGGDYRDPNRKKIKTFDPKDDSVAA